MKNIFNRKGFTLLELCIVMAVGAIVATMVVTFMIYATTQQAEITKEGKMISETTKVQKTVNEWIKKYDSKNYFFTISSGKITANRITQADPLQYQKASELYFSDKKIFEKIGDEAAKEKTEKLSDIKNLSFNQSEIDGQKEQLIKVTLTYENNKQQVLLFSLFSNVTRQRLVEGR